MKSASTSLKTLAEELGILKLAEELCVLSKQRATGELIVSNPAGEAIFYLFSGQLLYATGKCHRVRRWQRALKKHCSNWKNQAPPESNQKIWEYQLLAQGVANQQLETKQLKSVICTVTLEVLFELGNYKNLTYKWHRSQTNPSESSSSIGLSYLEVEPILTKTVQMWQQWQAAGLAKISPVLAPIISKQVNEKALGGWCKYLTGQLTLWDIASQMRKSVVAVTRALIPLAKKGLVRLRQIKDLPLPIAKTTEPTSYPVSEAKLSKSEERRPLIACIDDSPVVAQTLIKLLMPAGYKILSIQEPLRGIAQLVEHKPDLIFLDLLMPNVNGYSVCNFLRKTSLFDEIPIIILTQRDTTIDRNRAQLVGATDFLGKPPDPKMTLQLVQKYLGNLEDENIEGKSELLSGGAR